MKDETGTHLYVIGAEGLAFVTVGRGKHPEPLLRQFRARSPYKLRVLHTYKGQGALLPYVRAVLRGQGTAPGEWFLPGGWTFEEILVHAEYERVTNMAALQTPAQEGTRTKTGIGALIVQARKAQGLQQQEVAAMTGVLQKSLSRIEHERGEVSLRTVLRIARVLKMDLNALVPGEDTPASDD